MLLVNTSKIVTVVIGTKPADYAQADRNAARVRARKQPKTIVAMRCKRCRELQDRHKGSTKCLMMRHSRSGRVVCSGQLVEVDTDV